ncbi:hypothetical protein LEL_10434 [Akanthomyces lecanii RCEF 1005]|uniref:DUF7770 domain-containing protein n=1 Tax=Akanthomyces lecanii RCEF 1005 TaxID=1081108 RepID=A0A167YHN6_CORDF|nr:hypothetical protein LEL_10434 [Akanthomyces lecanii RCEF 1005]
MTATLMGFATTATGRIDLTNMDKHWNFSGFEEADATEPIVAVYICADGDLVDGQKVVPRRNSDHDAIFDSDDDAPPSDTKKSRESSEILPNHWALFLELRNGGGRAVRVEIAPGWQPTRPVREATVLVRSLTAEDRKLQSIVRSRRFSVVSDGDTTVQQVLESMCHKLRHRYLFTESGEGSRYWVYAVVQDLETAEILCEGEADAVEDELSIRWESGGVNNGQRRIRRGMFTEWIIRGEERKGIWF